MLFFDAAGSGPGLAFIHAGVAHLRMWDDQATALRDAHSVIEDKVWRAYGMLQTARTINSEETMDLLSAVRMGVNLKIIQDVPMATVNELFIFTQPAHLQKLQGERLNGEQRSIIRAQLIRNRMSTN